MCAVISSRPGEVPESAGRISSGGVNVAGLPVGEEVSSQAAMARDWNDLVLLPEGAAAPAPVEPEKRRGFFKRFREGLGRTREALGAEVRATLFDTLDAEAWERLEEALIGADVGAPATARIVSRLEEVAGGGATGEQLTDELTRLLAAGATVGTEESRHIDLRARPSVILVVGVNGTGKTTSAGKLGHHLRTTLGLNVVLAAADTFRAAAVEQLQVWGERSGCEVVTGPPNSDPGAVAFSAIDRGLATGADVIVIDTAGRLHTQDQLMAELGKIRRVIGQRLEGAPHETLLTDRRDHRPERPAAGRDLQLGHARRRDRPHQARRHGQGRHRRGHRRQAADPGEARRRGRGRGRPTPVRRERLRQRAPAVADSPTGPRPVQPDVMPLVPERLAVCSIRLVRRPGPL